MLLPQRRGVTRLRLRRFFVVTGGKLHPGGCLASETTGYGNVIMPNTGTHCPRNGIVTHMGCDGLILSAYGRFGPTIFARFGTGPSTPSLW